MKNRRTHGVAIKTASDSTPEINMTAVGPRELHFYLKKLFFFVGSIKRPSRFFKQPDIWVHYSSTLAKALIQSIHSLNLEFYYTKLKNSQKQNLKGCGFHQNFSGEWYGVGEYRKGRDLESILTSVEDSVVRNEPRNQETLKSEHAGAV